MNIAIVIPCYKVSTKILSVLNRIDFDLVANVYLVDDACPEQTGSFIKHLNINNKIKVLINEENLCVGGAVMRGYQEALKDNCDIVVKIDGDGQMDPSLISNFISPILQGKADYTKGNRFFNPEDLEKMPKIRLIGNAFLSFMNKLSSGYWNIFDPTNGYTAIHKKAIAELPLNKISQRYFFESDMLFRLNLIRAVVVDIPMKAVYEDEKSNLSIKKIFFEFLAKHFRNTSKRIFYNYYLRDMSVASFELPIGLALLSTGCFLGITTLINNAYNPIPTATGTIMFYSLSIIIGIQFLLAFINFDIFNTPNQPLSTL